MTTPNLFQNAKVAPAKKTAKRDKVQRVAIEGLETYAYICVVEKALKGLKETYRGIVEPQMMDQFVLDGKRINRKPDNFKGTEGSAVASCELRKRSSASVLTEVEENILSKHKIDVVPAETRFVINPEYINDSKLLQRVSDALQKVKDLPTDFIVADTKGATVSDESIDQVFSKPERVVRELLPIVGTMAVKPVMGELDLDTAMVQLTKVMNDDGE